MAGAVDDLVEPLGVRRVLGDPPVEGEGDGVEQAKGGARCGAELVEARLVPLLHHLGDAGDIHHALAIEREDGVVGIPIGEERLLVAGDLQVLGLPLLCQGLDDAGDQARKVALRVGGVFPPHHHVGAEGQIVADEDLAAERDADGEALVVAVPETDHIGVGAVGRLEGEHAEVAKPVGGDGVMLLDQVVTVEAKRVLHHVHHRVVGNRHVRARRVRSF